MAYNNYYQRLRVKSVQIFDEMFYEPENHDKSHKRNWERMGSFIFGISYDTYLSYLKIDTSDIPSIPSEAIAAMNALIDKLLAEEKHPVRLKRNAAKSEKEGKERKRKNKRK